MLRSVTSRIPAPSLVPGGRSRAWGLLWLLALAGCAHEPSASVPPAQSADSGLTQAAEAPAPPASPETSAPLSTEARFAQWLSGFRLAAERAGIREATLSSALDTAQLQSRIIRNDRNQGEYVRPVWAYLDSAASPLRVRIGRARLADTAPSAPAAQAAQARHGVPASVLVAIWGIETSFGSHLGDVRVIDALATLAFDGRREAWARQELMAALRIIDQGDIDAEHMIGSWAGAMGQTQFMPSTFLAHAVDADGDGRRDLWGSLDDVMGSTANYLQHSGWVAGEPCLTEVRLPSGFDPAQAESDIRRDASAWAQAGVRPVDDTAPTAALPAMHDASILLPAGLQGPAFMVGRNFRAVLHYNRANSYALAVCLLAQQIDGGPGVQATWPRDQRLLTRSEVMTLQSQLNALGFDAGEADGVAGPATRKALRAWQRQQGLPADGFVNAEVLGRLTASNEAPAP